MSATGRSRRLLSLLAILIAGGVAVCVRCLAEGDEVIWDVETAPKEEAQKVSYYFASLANSHGLTRLIGVLNKYPEFVNAPNPVTGEMLIEGAAEADCAETVHFLAARGAKLDVKDSFGRTPLHLAARRDFVSSAQALIEEGADIHVLTDDKDRRLSALDIAAQNGSERVVAVLLQHGAKLDSQPPETSYPAIHHAMDRSWVHRIGNRESFFKSNAPNIKRKRPLYTPTPAPDPAPGNATVIELLVKAGADLKGRNFEGQQPLHVAVRNANPEAVEVLLTKYRDQIEIDGRGFRGPKDYQAGMADPEYLGHTPLMFAVTQFRPYNAEAKLKIIELLVQHGADVNASETEGPFPRTAKEMYEQGVRDGSIRGGPDSMILELLTAKKNVPTQEKK